MYKKMIIVIFLAWATVAMTATLVAGAGTDQSQAERVAELRDALAHHHADETSGSEQGHSANQMEQFQGLSLIGFTDLGGGGFNADVWAHDDFAYVGTWGVWTPDGTYCPNDGTKVIDISNPSQPSVVNTLPAPAGTQTNDVKVDKIETDFFHGDLLVVSNEDCMEPGARGIELWDVSDPLEPEFLSRFGPEVAYDTPEFFDIGFGVHNTFIFEQDDRAYVAAVIDVGEVLQLIYGLPIIGDLRLIDVTDPRNPVQVGDWGIVKNLGLDPFEGQGDDPFKLLHDVWVEEEIAYLSYWDAGLILLDVSNPADPQFISQTAYAPGEEGNTHVAVPARDGKLVITGDEDFSPGPWGFMRIFDAQDVTAPFEIATYGTANTFVNPPPDAGDYTIHNVFVDDDKVYVSWYSDGVRVLDISRPETPHEIASFVPPDAPDPNGFLSEKTFVWGVYEDEELILASDMNGGLYVLELDDDDHGDDGDDDED